MVLGLKGLRTLALHVGVGLMGRNQTWKRPAEAPALCSR
jgi:hypothetical protein